MEHIISINEIIATIGEGDSSLQICVTADADYDPAMEKVAVALDSFGRETSASTNGEHLRLSWLPPAENVTEHLPRDEAADFAKDVFQNWVKRVRNSIPHKLFA